MEILLSKSLASVPIGKLLLEQDAVTQADLDRALMIQKKSGGRLGQILVSEKIITPLALAQAVARHHHKPWVNLLETECDPSLMNNRDLDDYLRFEVLPIARREGRVILATPDISFFVIEWAFRKYGNAFDIVITSPRDILWTIEKEFGKVIDIEGRFHLSRHFPERSTLVTLTGSLQIVFWGLTLGLLLLAMAAGAKAIPVIFLAVNVVYGVTLVFKSMLFITGRREQVWKKSAPLPNLREQDLPVYTLLIPLYREAGSLPKLLDSLRLLDYPKSKLDVKLVVEADDEETIEEAKTLKPDGMVEIIRVPFSLPRTKPKACNYALRFARGEYVTIYDAEDQPDPLQLKKAVQAFRDAPANVICLQARLNYYNRDDNWLTRFFALEYASWFDFLLPGLQTLDIPIPLGGTSNHISLGRLRELGQWDPYNVTEDADLGVRIALSGDRTRVLSSLTMEEAPARLGGWMRQRTRWIKGYMQTWLVHMRHPRAMLEGYGWRGLLGFHLFIGGPCFVFLTTPVMLLVSLLYAGGQISASIPPWLGMLALANLGFGYGTHVWYACDAIRARRWFYLLPYALLFPLYWLLHSLASFKALWQLLTNPFFWEKTQHGISQQLRNSEQLTKEFT